MLLNLLSGIRIRRHPDYPFDEIGTPHFREEDLKKALDIVAGGKRNLSNRRILRKTTDLAIALSEFTEWHRANRGQLSGPR